MSDDNPIYRPGRMIAGRYRITSALSKGGMGAVYLAQQVSLGRDVALKVMLERGSDPELLRRFDVEARAVCQLKHPNIITYHDYGRDDDGHPYLVMEYLAGYAGTKLVYGERRPGLLDLVHVVAQVCSALSEAHGKGIIHRDLKWSNVMICPQSHDPYFAKLIDFGIMKVATDGSSGDQRALTRTGMLLGTPEYMSPEAICGIPIDGRADQYSLAIMLWEALEGHRPFDAVSHFELLRQQVQDALPPFEAASELIATYPDLEAVLAQALEKHPDDRFADIIAFQQALMVAVGLARAPTASAPRQVRRAAGDAHTRDLRGDRADREGRRFANGMPPSRPRLPAAPESPRPVDTAHKTGREPAEIARRRPRWPWLAGAFVLFLALGFGVVAAIIAATRKPATDDRQIAAIEQPDATSATTDTTPIADATPVETHVAAAAETIVADTASTLAATAPLADTMASAAPEIAAQPEVVATPEVVIAQADVAADTTPADATATAPKPIGTGHLFVQVDPWGNVAIDGRPVGRAPYDGDVKAGPHRVTITNMYFKGAYSFPISVDAGRRAARTIVLDEVLEKVE